ncbi:MAG: B12-binding domain-containing radical SAM protein [Armatimonadetes bacterium]|nr:B12-binding domain-containing radical SAM protein [Armatimonadota bacterium]
MRVLLLGMPDVASCFDRVMRMPNLGIVSIAANLTGADVRVLDLVLHPKAVRRVVSEHLERLKPDVVGLSAMTFQYDTAKEVASVVRQVRPGAATVLGGYHATLATDLIAADPDAEVFDFLVRGEGEVAMNLLVEALAGRRDLSDVPGLSYRRDGRFVHNPQAALLDLSRLNIPLRSARLSYGFTYFGKPFDAVETSRGCPKQCNFCSVRQLYGRSYRFYPVERVLADISDARERGARGIFFVDDNINLKPGHLRELCGAITEAGLDNLEYITQADVAGFLNEPELPGLMRTAGFSGVFLGIESVAAENWKFLGKRNSPEGTRKVIRSLRKNGIGVAGGFIIGNPEDDASAIRDAFRTARMLPVDHAIMWCLTPYPGTEAREMMLAEGLVENPSEFRRYNGFICNVRTRYLTHTELVRAIAREGAKLYFNPAFFLRSRAWPRSLRAAWIYFRTVFEYLTRARRNSLFASRHKM